MMFRKYILTFCLAVISCVATKTIQEYTETGEYVSQHGVAETAVASEVIHIMYEMKLI